MRRHERLLVFAVAASACFEYELAPPWVVGGPIVLANRVSVIAGGPWSGSLPPIWSGEVRANPLPGERIRLHSHVVAPEAVEIAEPQFFVCSVYDRCVTEGWREFPDCSEIEWPQIPGESPCRVTRFDSEAEFRLPGVRPLDQEQLEELGLAGLLSFQVRVIAGTTDIIDTETCVDRFVSREASLFDCAIDSFSVTYQQGAALVDSLMPAGVSLGIDSAAVPFEWLWQEPNVHPVLLGIPVTLGSTTQEALDGSVFTVAPGTPIRVGTARASREQTYATLGTQLFAEWEETPTMDLWLDESASLLADSDEFSPTAFAMPDVDVLRVFATLRDGRGGVTWATFELRAE